MRLEDEENLCRRKMVPRLPSLRVLLCFANSHSDNMAKALKDVVINPRIRIEEHNNISFAVSCRHCTDPIGKKLYLAP